MKKPFALIVEDDPDLSGIFAKSLETAGFDVEIIQDGQVAMQRLDEVTADVIVLDMHLPNVAGNTILERIRSDSRFGATRVVITTADTLMAETLREKHRFVLVKPISFGQLRDLAKRLKPIQ
jgi:DNA-binding response OmpR family regulator